MAGGKLFAQIPELEEGVNLVYDLFTSNMFRLIMAVALMILGITMGVGISRGQEGVIQKFAPWIAGVTIVGAASPITEYFMQGD